MFVRIDDNTYLNTDVTIAYIEQVEGIDEAKTLLTRVVFADPKIEDVISPTDFEEVVAMVQDALRQDRGMPQELVQWLDEVPVYPAPTDTPLTQEQLPLDGERTEEYLNRVMRATSHE